MRGICPTARSKRTEPDAFRIASSETAVVRTGPCIPSIFAFNPAKAHWCGRVPRSQRSRASTTRSDDPHDYWYWNCCLGRVWFYNLRKGSGHGASTLAATVTALGGVALLIKAGREAPSRPGSDSIRRETNPASGCVNSQPTFQLPFQRLQPSSEPCRRPFHLFLHL